jgi:uncharacterized protein YxjI
MTSSSLDYQTRLQPDQFVIRQKVFKLFGNAFHVYGQDGQVIFYSKQKAFKLKEDIRLYSGEDMKEELLAINATKVIDFSSSYDVTDSATGAKIGGFRRKGWSSMIQDTWQILSPNGQQIGEIKEDSTALAILRRITDFGMQILAPQGFNATLNGQPVCTYQQNRNPFVRKLSVNFVPGTGFDHRLGIAGGILLAAIEGRQT